MFSGCTSFNQDLSVWSIDKIILFNRSDRNRTMFDNAPAMQIDNIPFTFIHYIGLPTKNGGKSKKTRANKKNKRRTQKTRKNKNK